MKATASMKKNAITIGSRQVGSGHPCYLIAEIGINHNGDIDIARRLIDKAVEHGFDAVKFQKRTIDVVYTPEELATPRETPFGTTNGDLKRGLEFGVDEYKEIDNYCKEKGIHWFCSPWDIGSVDFLEQFEPLCYKIASASLTDDELLLYIKNTGRPIILSTGMSTIEEIDHAVELLEGADLILFQTSSTYPSKDSELNLAVIETLRNRYQIPIGYSGHEVGVMPSVMAVTGFDACAVERHVTLDRSMWGSDQAASLEPRGMELLSKYLAIWPIAKGDGVKCVLEGELPIKAKLRRIG
ncbi:N-acetylneuraminate synthase family protein [Magnetovibrio blakemorei]|uniref:N-acetylneuraminate synthase n=1 Tax=Magnetovibrio blakemorei TaxID=28181 RepID=A0A1E5Q2Y8_9PROT|nr:N-acetylneuraminate synthase family protein [Magnetovibrio blakemorei]OEJ63835.1 N-acetylneuraminate synthase [Magnetovibrio blakemorei]